MKLLILLTTLTLSNLSFASTRIEYIEAQNAAFLAVANWIKNTRPEIESIKIIEIVQGKYGRQNSGARENFSDFRIAVQLSDSTECSFDAYTAFKNGQWEASGRFSTHCR